MNYPQTKIDSTNLKRTCKICLEEKSESVPITSMVEFTDLQTSSIQICDILSKISTQPVLTKYGPDLICHDCIIELKPVYFFILKYEESLRIVNEFLFSSNKVKTESDNFILGVSGNELIESGDDETVETDEISNIENDDLPNESYENIGNNENYENDSKDTKIDIFENVPELDVKPIEEEKQTVQNPDSMVVKRSQKLKQLSVIKQKKSKDFPLIFHRCPICPKEFTALELREHVRTHKDLKKYLHIPRKSKVAPDAKFCVKPGSRPNISFLEKPDKMHCCPFCNVSFKIEEFRIHVDSHRKQDEFSCEQCPRVFKRISHLNIHRLKHRKEYPYMCEQCGKGFVIQSNFNCHILTHKKEELPHECQYCNKRFSNPAHLSRHITIHTENVSYGNKYRVLRCHRCLKSFKDKNSCREHTCVPLNTQMEISFPCKLCKSVFKHRTNLYAHNRTVHEKRGSNALCSVCGKYVTNIYVHMTKHNEKKVYECNLCKKGFFSKAQLRKHLLVHSGIKPFVCSICAKAFNNLYNLQVHERMHKGDKNHVCHICGKGFLEKSYLKKHLNVHLKK